MRYAGIDEAGYGPTLGPLAIAATAVDSDNFERLGKALAAHGVKDSKALHKAGNIAPLEAVALGGLRWLTGAAIHTAADVFIHFDENNAQRKMPWQAGADALTLPIKATRISAWSIEHGKPCGMRGALIHADAYNNFIAQSGNKAALELHHISGLLRWAGGTVESDMVVDRLGGRRYYKDALQSVWPQESVSIISEVQAESRYQAGPHRVGFLVGAESRWPLTALASCIAKYARELHMLLFNQYWTAIVPDLKPTAGYPEDARRFLADLGTAHYESIGPHLVRGWPRF